MLGCSRCRCLVGIHPSRSMRPRQPSSTGETERGESFALELYDRAGTMLECLQFETLEIALAQAAALLGLHPADWRAGSGA